ncbi:MAG: hypothetical protein BGP13_00075 [Sphingobacteriales bacterium 40-81]|nr:MAG: hypothetical protein BGP13_00075 [Sphingobacteriales bacterium 40-81]
MKIFPKTVTEKIWKEHLATYSHTIVHYMEKHRRIIEATGQDFIPYNLCVCPLCADSYFYLTPDGMMYPIGEPHIANELTG